MKQFKQIIQEGVYDPGIFKAFFLAGGPGSGKTYVTNRATGGMGLKMVNSDIRFERYLQKAGLSLKMPDSEASARDPLRQRAKQITGDQMDRYIRGRLGLVIDATGRDYNVINRQRSMLQMLGYDTYMVFVNTSLDVALQRNRNRPRSIPEYIVTNSWNGVQSNIGQFQRIFSPNKMLIIDNNRSEKELVTQTLGQAAKFIRGQINKRPDNYIAKQWIAKELEAKKRI